MKDMTRWIVVTPENHGVIETIAHARHASITRAEIFFAASAFGVEWPRLQEQGFRVVKIKISEAEKCEADT